MFALLDTRVLIRLDQDHPSLGPEARKRADAALQQGCLGVSSITFCLGNNHANRQGTDYFGTAVNGWRRDLPRLELVEITVDGSIGIAAA